MACEEHVALLKQGVDVWNDWRGTNPDIRPYLGGANFSDADLRVVNLSGSDLQNAQLGNARLNGGNFRSANLRGASLANAECIDADFVHADLNSANLNNAAFGRAHFREANLENANLCGVNLRRSDLSIANLNGADLSGAHLSYANFRAASLIETDLSDAVFVETGLGNVDLTETKGLDRCKHFGPSTVDHRTLERSKNVPLSFWQGCGLPDGLIDYMPSLVGDAIHFYSCFISYSSKDQEFADRIHADLQSKGVRCWFAPHDLPIGAKTWDGIDEAIRARDKMLLILSKAAVASDWVEDEVTTAFAEERRRKKLVLFPVRLDDIVMETKEPWAGKLRDNRNIGDFTRWKEYDAYQVTFERVLKGLQAER